MREIRAKQKQYKSFRDQLLLFNDSVWSYEKLKRAREWGLKIWNTQRFMMML
jgi:hypothetical protein